MELTLYKKQVMIKKESRFIMCQFCNKFWKILPDYERHIMSEKINDDGFKVITSTKLGKLKNIKLAVSSTHLDTHETKIFDWKFCPVCGNELSEEANK